MKSTIAHQMFNKIQMATTEMELMSLVFEVEEMASSSMIDDIQDVMILQQMTLIKANEIAIHGLVQLINSLAEDSPKRDEMH